MTLSICAIIKDTPDYLMQAWINHHFDIGVKSIYCYVDVDSKPIYQDPRVEYIYMTPELRYQLEQIGHKYAIYEDQGTHIQEGVYNDCLLKHRDDCDWLACIDDDEFIHIDLSVLDKYKDESCIYLPWKMMYTTDVRCVHNLNGYKCIRYSSLDKKDNMWNGCYLKSILNTHVIQYCRTVHFGDIAGVFCMDDQRLKYLINKWMSMSEKNRIFLPMVDKLDTNYISHYKFRSFEEWVSSIVDREDLGDDNFTIGRFIRTIKGWFDNMKSAGEDIQYDKDIVVEYLKMIGREELINTPYFDWADIDASYEYTDGVCLLIYNNSTNPIPQDVISQITHSTTQETRVLIVDYVRYANQYQQPVVDKRLVNHWVQNLQQRKEFWGVPQTDILEHVLLRVVKCDGLHITYIK